MYHSTPGLRVIKMISYLCFMAGNITAIVKEGNGSKEKNVGAISKVNNCDEGGVEGASG